MKKQPRAFPQWQKSVLSSIGFLFWVFAAIVISQTLLGAMFLTIIGETFYATPLWMTLYIATYYSLTCVLLIFLPAKIKKIKTSREELGLSGTPRWRDIGLGLGGFVVYFLLAALLMWLFTSLFSWFDADQAQNVGFSYLTDIPSRILAFIALVIVAPIAEELIFRGWLYAKLRAHAHIWVAILLTSALFAAAHGAWNVAVNVFAMSIVMCLMRELTGTIWSTIILHTLKNALAFYILLSSGIL